MNAKKIMYTIAASMVVGAVIGMLYAPNEGSETRRKIRKLRHKFGPATLDNAETDRDALVALKNDLQRELNKINARLDG